MEQLLKKRIEALQVAADAKGLGALVIFSQAASMLGATSTHGNLRYLLDWTSWGSPSMLLFPVDREPTLVVPIPGDVEHAHESIPWLVDIRFSPASNYGLLAHSLLLEKGIKGGIGVIGVNELTHKVYNDLLEQKTDWEFIESDRLLDQQRIVKDETALAKMRKAAETSDYMFEALVHALRKPSIPAWQAQVAMERAGREYGAEIVWSWFVSGPHPDHPRVRREENARHIQIGDCIVAAIILVYEGYFGHTLRMFTIGDPSNDHLRVWQAVSEAQKAASALFKPGVRVGLPNSAAEEILFRHFPEAREGDKIRFRPCHFIGLDYAEFPTSEIQLSISTTDVDSQPPEHFLRAGMTMEIHPNVRPPGLGFGAVGDVFFVTENGGERLTKFNPEITVINPE